MHVNMSKVYEYDGWQCRYFICIAAHVISLHIESPSSLSRCTREFYACVCHFILATIEAKICGTNNYTPRLLPQCNVAGLLKTYQKCLFFLNETVERYSCVPDKRTHLEEIQCIYPLLYTYI